jgi:hypothetical protein
VNDPFPDWISEFLDGFFTWLGHAWLWLLLVAVVLFVLYLVGNTIYEYYLDEMGRRHYVAKYYSATPPTQREQNLVKVVDTTVESMSESRIPAEDPPLMSDDDLLHELAAQGYPMKEGTTLDDLAAQGYPVNRRQPSPMQPSTGQLNNAIAVIDELAKIDPTVYSKLRFNITRLDATTRTEAFAAAQQGRMDLQLLRLFTEVASEHKKIIDGVSDPTVRKQIERFAELLLKQTAAGLGGKNLTAMRAMDNITAEPYLPPPPPRPGFIEWLFGG